jgi:integrase
MLWSGSSHGDLSEGKVRWIVKECGDPQLDRIPTDYVDRAVMKLRAAGKAPGTINRYLSALHAVLGWGAKPGRRLVPVMPEFSWQDEDEGRIRYLTPTEEDRLVRTLQALGYSEIADLCVVALDTGCRRGELLSAAAHQLDGKWLRLWHTKSGHPRSVPLTDRSRAILEAAAPFQGQGASAPVRLGEGEGGYGYEPGRGLRVPLPAPHPGDPARRIRREPSRDPAVYGTQEYSNHTPVRPCLGRHAGGRGVSDGSVHLSTPVGVPAVLYPPAPRLPAHPQGAVLEPVE